MHMVEHQVFTFANLKKELNMRIGPKCHLATKCDKVVARLEKVRDKYDLTVEPDNESPMAKAASTYDKHRILYHQQVTFPMSIHDAENLIGSLRSAIKAAKRSGDTRSAFASCKYKWLSEYRLHIEVAG